MTLPYTVRLPYGVRVVWNHWFWRRVTAPWVRAITIRNTIYVMGNPPLSEQTLRHELRHVEQWRYHGTIGFVVRYLWGWVRHGYRMNPFEIDARRYE